MREVQNIVKIDDDIIYYKQVGDQTREKSYNTIALLRFLTGGMKEVKFLVDYSNSGKMEEASIKSGFYALKVLPISKVAIIGATPELKKLVITMAGAAKKSDMIYFAKSRKTAIEWLKK